MIGVVALLLGCANPADDQGPTVGDCAPMRTDAPPPRDPVALRTLLDEIHRELHAELAGAAIDLEPLTSDSDFFQANLDLSTVEAPPLERTYRVLYNPRLFDDPPTQPAFVAILAHELAHVRDYTGMDAEELIRFGIWYATGDVAAYERETDEAALWLGCGAGLAAYREWLYDHIPAEAVAEKERVYYTPAEIAAWMDAHAPE